MQLVCFWMELRKTYLAVSNCRGMGDKIEKTIPRDKRLSGHEKQDRENYTPRQIISGAWEIKMRSLYPVASEWRGMRDKNEKPIPRDKRLSGHGRQDRENYTPRQIISGAWDIKMRKLYPAANDWRDI